MFLRRLAGPLYAIALLMLVIPATDFVSNVWPLNPGDFRWRFGMVGLLSGFLLTPLLGLLLAAVVAAITEDVRMLRAVSAVAGAGALILVLFVGLFTLDVLQFRPEVPAERLGSFDFANVRSMVKHLIVAATLGWMSLTSWRAVSSSLAGKGKAPRAVATQTVLSR